MRHRHLARRTVAVIFTVGLASNIVHAQRGCIECRTVRPHAPGGNPFLGDLERINSAWYLAGGTPFGSGIVSPNLTPDATGRPAGLTFRQFRDDVMRAGHEPGMPGKIVQVMPLAGVRQDAAPRPSGRLRISAGDPPARARLTAAAGEPPGRGLGSR